ncbi:MAG: hypothetical protein ACR2KX_07815, partial [Chitinophagaceae bacterium]
YNIYKVPGHFIHHGVANAFTVREIAAEVDGKIRVGFSGNLLRNDIDRNIFLQIIRENPGVVIECWGSHNLLDGNLGGVEDTETINFIHQLKQSVNVILHGVVPAAILAKEFLRMDAFLICYDVEKDQSRGTNYHKVMEYISTGKVIISNNISTYKNEPSLVQMVKERSHNNNLPLLFKKVIQSLEIYNTAYLQKFRKEYAYDNTYRKQLERIEKLLL